MSYLKIIHAYSLKLEKAAVFHGKSGHKSWFRKLKDTVINKFLATAYVVKLSNAHKTKCKNSDLCCVVEDLSLALAIVAYLNKHLHNLVFYRLKAELDMAAIYRIEGLNCEQIKARVNNLIALTL